jgi:hypothetical protein
VGWGRSGSRWRKALKFFLGRGRRGKAQGPSRSRCWWCSRWIRWALEGRVACREKPAWGRKPGVIAVLADNPLKSTSTIGGLLPTCTDAVHFEQDGGHVFKWLRAMSSSRIKRHLVYIWLHMLLMPRRFVDSRLKSGLEQKLALAVVLYWAALVTVTSNRLIIRACALRSLSKSLVLGAFAQAERSQLLQLLLEDNAKPADAQGDSSNF